MCSCVHKKERYYGLKANKFKKNSTMYTVWQTFSSFKINNFTIIIKLKIVVIGGVHSIANLTEYCFGEEIWETCIQSQTKQAKLFLQKADF